MILEKHIQPEEASPEFKVWLRPLSYEIVSSTKAKMEGDNLPEILLKAYIQKVDGLTINGKDIVSGEDFYTHAPTKYANKVIEAIMKDLVPSEEEKKSSP